MSLAVARLGARGPSNRQTGGLPHVSPPEQLQHLSDGEGYEAGDAFDLKYEEWERRDWMVWLPENLVFPFKATRQEDMDDADFQQDTSTRLFQVGHTLGVLGLEGEDEKMGVIVKAKEKGQIGHLPLADLG